MLLYGRRSLQSSLSELRATVSTVSMIAVIVLLAALPLAGASLNCSFPGSTPEGCVYCFSCKVETTTLTHKTTTFTSIISITKCKQAFPFATPSLEFCMMLHRLGFPVTTKKEITMYTTTEEEECICDPDPVAMHCLNSSDNMFILEYNKTCFNTTTVCHWNLPKADQVYMHPLKQDIEGNPYDSTLGCENKLIMKSEGWNEDLVTCGSLPTTRPAVKIHNSILNTVPSVFFWNENGMEESVRILVSLRSRMDMNNNARSITIDTCAPPSGKPFSTCCECPIPIKNITELCPNNLITNQYIERLITLSSTPNMCPGIGRTGFSGLKGCIGAEFLMQDSPLTTEQCEDTELGLSEMEAKVFLSPDGGSLWCGCNQVTSGPESFCEGDDATRPDAVELIKLERLIAHREDADEFANADNQILQEVAVFLQDNTNIPVLSPCP